MAGSSGNGGRVLVVDDNVALAENIAEVLAIDGFVTEVAASAEEALPKALSDDVVVVVTDFRLPGITGAELVVRVRRARSNVRCIVISAHTDDGTVRTAEAAGARFLAKPLDLGRLTRAVSGADGMA
jgi:two-component system nitrogen regulation response regulator GlnG